MVTVPLTVGRPFLRRIVGAALLDRSVYEEVEADRAATAQAAIIVLLSSLAAGIGARGFSGGSVADIAFVSMVALLSWGAFALLLFEIGARLLPEATTRANVGELLRTVGFAATPSLLNVAGAVPGLGLIVFVVTSVWMLAAVIVGVRQALDYTSTRRAIGVCAFAWALAMAFAAVLGMIFSPTVS